MFVEDFRTFLRQNLNEATFVAWHGVRDRTAAGSSGTPGRFSGAASAGLGDFFATDNTDYASRYGTPTEFNITINKPYHMPIAEFLHYDRGPGMAFRHSLARRKELEQIGHDGIIVVHPDGVKEFILFDKSQATPAQPLSPYKRPGEPMSPQALKALQAAMATRWYSDGTIRDLRGNIVGRHRDQS